MPFGLNSYKSISTLNTIHLTNTLPASNKTTKNHLSNRGYAITSMSVKASEIKPLASSLHLKSKMSVNEYTQYKELMKNLGLHTKTVSFAQEVSYEHVNTLSPVTSGNALFDDDTDYVPFEEHEPFRLQRLEQLNNLRSSNTASMPGGISTNSHPSRQEDLKQQTTASHYETPRNQPIPIIYDIPKKHETANLYDTPRKQPVPIIYSIPKSFC